MDFAKYSHIFIDMKTKPTEKVPLFGRKLRTLRQEKRLTQEELAREINLSRQMISYFESRAMNPTVDVLRRLADYFGVSADEFLYESGRKQRPGPKSTLERKLDAVRRLPVEKQKAITTVLDMAIHQAKD